MKRGDKTVLSVSVALAVGVVVAVAFSILVLDRKARPSASGRDSNSSLLVVTWGPSLCTVEPSNSGCRSGHVTRLGQVFVLHGLWPQPSTEQYCDVPKRISDRKRTPVQLPDDLKDRLNTMLSDAPLMTTHEWYAHGTCSGVTPGEYFSIATELADQAVEVLNPLFATASGSQVTVRSVRQTLDAAFGGQAGTRAALACKAGKGGDVAYEVKLSLPSVLDLREGGGALSLGRALGRGPAIGPGCGKALVP